MKRRGLSLVEITVVVALVATVLGVAYYKFVQDRRNEVRQASRVDRQQAMRRFLLRFREDMLTMDELKSFSVRNAADPLFDMQLIEMSFNRYTPEGTEEVEYRYDFNGRRFMRLVTGKADMVVENIAGLQLLPYDFAREMIRNSAELRYLYYLEARIRFVQTDARELAPGVLEGQHDLMLKVYPRLKSSQNKASFNRFRLNSRFTGS